MPPEPEVATEVPQKVPSDPPKNEDPILVQEYILQTSQKVIGVYVSHGFFFREKGLPPPPPPPDSEILVTERKSNPPDAEIKAPEAPTEE